MSEKMSCRLIALFLTFVSLPGAVVARIGVDYEAEAIFNAGSGDFAPYYIASNRHGILTQPTDALLRAGAFKSLSSTDRFSYGFGAEIVTGYSSPTDYARYNPETGIFGARSESPAPIFIQQLYGEIKYRGVFLSAGMKQHQSALLDFDLSSGDLVESGNSRPIPQVRAGFLDFQNIPLTHGWVQIQGEFSYGKFADNNWMRDHYNYYDWHINLGGFYTYKRCYFRTKPSMPLSVTVGMQTAGLFGGTTRQFADGKMVRETKCSESLKTFFKMFLPTGGDNYYEGNSLGSWDVMARYRSGGGTEIKAYVQKPWEDGSGIGWMNGFDGLWGLEYKSPSDDSPISGAVVEYLDFTNQSGPIHWAPDDFPGTTITTSATGGDQYYNNFQSNSYMNYGMSIGTPFLPSPIYNRDGYMGFVHNRVRGFHAGISGNIGIVGYRVLGGYRKGWGDGRVPAVRSVENTSMMVEAVCPVRAVSGLSLKAQVAFDAGSIYGDNFGACVTLRYDGSLIIGRK